MNVCKTAKINHCALPSKLFTLGEGGFCNNFLWSSKKCIKNILHTFSLLAGFLNFFQKKSDFWHFWRHFLPDYDPKIIFIYNLFVLPLCTLSGLNHYFHDFFSACAIYPRAPYICRVGCFDGMYILLSVTPIFPLYTILLSCIQIFITLHADLR